MRWSSSSRPEPFPPPGTPKTRVTPTTTGAKPISWVQAAVANGLTPVLLQIRIAPSWAQRCPAAQIDTGAPCDPDPAALAAFATAAARRYSGQFGGLPRVRYWQGLNEPNLSLFFNPQYDGDKPVSPDLYRTLINSFYAAVKAVDPSNLVLIGSLGPIAVPKYTIGPMRFTRLLLCMSGGKHPPSGRRRLRRGRPLRHLRHPPIYDRRAHPRRRRQRRRDRRSGQAAEPAQRRRPGGQDQGRVPPHAAVDHRVLLGLQAARLRRTAVQDPRSLGRRGDAQRLVGGRHDILLVQPARLPPPAARPTAKPCSPASTSGART